jgi:hypothetical protein
LLSLLLNGNISIQQSRLLLNYWQQ